MKVKSFKMQSRSLVRTLLSVCMMLVMGLPMVSCDQGEDEVAVNASRSKEVPTQATRVMRRASPGWSEGGYDAILAGKYQIQTPVKFASNHYRFQVISSDFSSQEIWIKYFSPQGNIVYERMEKRGSTFEADRTFQQEGKYSYAFFVRKAGGVYPRISSPGLSIQVEMPISIPPAEDDYAENVRIYTYQSGPSDQWYFVPRQCVSWVALKVNQMWGTQTAFNNRMFGGKLGYAWEWKQKFLNNGYSVDRNPRAGDIIWWGKNGGNGVSSDGHVGFIHAVTNGIIHYSEYNHDGNGRHRENTISIASSRAEYIHVQRQR